MCNVRFNGLFINRFAKSPMIWMLPNLQSITIKAQIEVDEK